MCILLKLHYAKFDVSRLFCSKGMEEKPLGGIGSTSLVKEGLKCISIQVWKTAFYRFSITYLVPELQSFEDANIKAKITDLKHPIL